MQHFLTSVGTFWAQSWPWNCQQYIEDVVGSMAVCAQKGADGLHDLEHVTTTIHKYPNICPIDIGLIGSLLKISKTLFGIL